MEKRGSLKFEDIGEIIASPTQKRASQPLAECTPIDTDTLDGLVKRMKDVAESNESLLLLLDTEKNQYLFLSRDLRKLIATTESVRTKISIIEMIAPRLRDPAEDRVFFLSCFKYSEEKEKVTV